ncbi:MAG: hypothetical protein K9G62_05775 [Alphaproteobacteria bacterium]|nr:hypothetical protein [Alphaproteobacteria bacterium]
MAKAKPFYEEEIDNIKGDLRSLAQDSASLASHVKRDGAQAANELAAETQKKLEDLYSKGQDEFKFLQEYVQKNPTRSITLAFFAGLIGSYLFKRRG